MIIDSFLQTDSVQTGISSAPLWSFEEAASKDYFVKLNSRQAYKVTLVYTVTVPLGIFQELPRSPDQLATSDIVKQCLEILIKHGLSLNCLAVGKNPDAFFLPEYRQIELMRQAGRNPLGSYYVSHVCSLAEWMYGMNAPHQFYDCLAIYRTAQDRLRPILGSRSRVSGNAATCWL
jgi:hypothetical protein